VITQFVLDSESIGTLGNQIILIIGAVGTLVTVITTLVVTIKTRGAVNTVHDTSVSALVKERERVQQLTELLSKTSTVVPPQQKETPSG
jgi:hypothetical protein